MKCSVRLLSVFFAILVAWIGGWSSMSLAHSPKTRGQTVYVPVYSTIAHISRQNMDLTVTLSIRNTDEFRPITVTGVSYFDTHGNEIGDHLDAEKVLGPLASTQIVIRREEYRGDFGANFIVVWRAEEAVVDPLVEAVMVGSQGTQAFAFVSRGVVISHVDAK